MGTLLALESGSTQEVVARISKGWKTFFALKRILCNQSISRRKRLALFDATVAATVLWCTESWALKQTDKDLLHAARNQMLRKMVGRGRHPDEKWVDWVISSTRAARDVARQAGVRS